MWESSLGLIWEAQRFHRGGKSGLQATRGLPPNFAGRLRPHFNLTRYPHLSHSNLRKSKFEHPGGRLTRESVISAGPLGVEPSHFLSFWMEIQRIEIGDRCKLVPMSRG